MISNFRDRPEFVRGRNGEQRVAAWLQERGWYVIPSYDFSGEDGDKAPKMQGLRERIVIPDLDVSRGGVRRWVEVKTKEKPDFTYTTQTWDHGIEHYDDYLRVQEETGSEAWLAIYETSTGELLMQSLRELGKPRRSRMNGRPMAYWPKEKFVLVNIFDETEE